MYVIGYPLGALVGIIDSLLMVYTFVIIASAVLSWVNPDPLNPLVRIIRGITDPALDKIRPYIPVLGGIDLTPLVLILGIAFVRSGILPIIQQFAFDLTR